MKKLTKANIDDLQKMMPVLDEEIQRFVLGGGDNSQMRTDCFFECMTYLCNSLSGEDCLSADEFAGCYESYIQSNNTDPNYDMGTGVDPFFADNFLSGYFSFGLTDGNIEKNKLNEYLDGYEGKDAISKSQEYFEGKNLMAIVNYYEEGKFVGEHAVIITGYNPTFGGFICFDPQKEGSGIKNAAEIIKIYDVDGLAN